MDKITITGEDGIVKEVNFLTILSLDEYKSVYLAYCEEEIKDSHNIILFAKMTEEDGKMYLNNIDDLQERLALQREFERKLDE